MEFWDISTQTPCWESGTTVTSRDSAQCWNVESWGTFRFVCLQGWGQLQSWRRLLTARPAASFPSLCPPWVHAFGRSPAGIGPVETLSTNPVDLWPRADGRAASRPCLTFTSRQLLDFGDSSGRCWQIYTWVCFSSPLLNLVPNLCFNSLWFVLKNLNADVTPADMCSWLV